jgi:hypothetical protein
MENLYNEDLKLLNDTNEKIDANKKVYFDSEKIFNDLNSRFNKANEIKEKYSIYNEIQNKLSSIRKQFCAIQVIEDIELKSLNMRIQKHSNFNQIRNNITKNNDELFSIKNKYSSINIINNTIIKDLITKAGVCEAVLGKFLNIIKIRDDLRVLKSKEIKYIDISDLKTRLDKFYKIFKLNLEYVGLSEDLNKYMVLKEKCIDDIDSLSRQFSDKLVNNKICPVCKKPF